MRESTGRQRAGRAGFAIAVGATVLALLLPTSATAAAPLAAAASAPTDVIVTFDRAPGVAGRRAVEDLGGTVHQTFTLIDGLTATMPANAIPGLRRNPHVTSVEIDGTVSTMEPVVEAQATGDYEYDNAWGVVHIGSKTAHDAGIRGQGIKVAVIDTGIDYVHDLPPTAEPPVVDPEFLGNYVGGHNFITGTDDPLDDNGHGTHVAGILAAERNEYLVVGVAPEVDLYALKILNAAGEGDVSDLILALQWAVGHDIDVANMSLGTHEISPALETAVANAAAAGLLMAAASGNTVTLPEIFNGCAVTYPGAYPQVLSTTFTNPNDSLTGYSCTGPEVDVAAPGDNIFSPVPVGGCLLCSPNGYSAQSGTSMASPHLAGTIALVLDAGIADTGTPGLFDDVRARLCSTANVAYGVQSIFGNTPIPTSDTRYPKYFGCGILDASEAVLGGGPPPPDNDPPVAAADDATTAEDTPADVAVLANDSDPDADTITVTGATDPAHGTTSVNANGTVRYAPDANYAGDDSFAYTIGDGHGGSATATVTMHVTPTNDPPVAGDDTATVLEDGFVDVSVLGNDTDVEGTTLTVTGTSAAVNGTAVVNANGTVRFTPNTNFAGAASFQYTVSDGSAQDTGAVAVTVGPANDAPVAVNDSATTAQGQAVTISVLVNDSDIDGGALSVSGVSDPPHGTAVANANGTITYTPDAGYSGADAFGYTAFDGSATSNLATVSVAISAAPPPPSTLHIGDLDRTASSSGKTWTAKVTIRAHSAAHANVSGVVISGTWSAGATGSASCTTATNGTCTVQLTKLARATVGSVTFTVTNATKAAWTYTAAINHDPDPGPDSTGTVITVPRPS